jgi:serine phosphatase RsbU (regulator of sigma subunit)
MQNHVMEKSEQPQKAADGTVNTPDSRSQCETPLSWHHRLRVAINTLVLRKTPLWEDIAGLGSWLECEAAPVATAQAHDCLTLEVTDTGTLSARFIGSQQHPDLPPFGHLRTFLEGLDVRKVQLDPRLERNQIEDVFALLHFHRAAIALRTQAQSSRHSMGRHLTDQGVHTACADISIQDQTLIVTYSYCTLGFSRVVHWLERRNQHFRDHRTLFHVAPRYALAFTSVVLGPIVAYAALDHQWSLLVILLAAGLMLWAVLYVFIMTVGSIEYDNEEKAYRLGKAYHELKKYTTRVQNDIERARAVQLRFLPDLASLPGMETLEWAASFEPADEVAGDYYDVASLDDQRVALIFSDVCGHGMGAAFITAVIKTSFQAWVDNPGTLSDLISQLNDNLVRLIPEESFAAVFLAIYDKHTHCLTYANCGHQPEPWLIRPHEQSNITSLDQARNLILGIEEDIPVTTSPLQLQPGDTLLMVSDGIVENMDLNGSLYGTDRFEGLINAETGATATRLVDTIAREAQAFSRHVPQNDDRTALAFTIR